MVLATACNCWVYSCISCASVTRCLSSLLLIWSFGCPMAPIFHRCRCQLFRLWCWPDGWRGGPGGCTSAHSPRLASFSGVWVDGGHALGACLYGGGFSYSPAWWAVVGMPIYGLKPFSKPVGASIGPGCHLAQPCGVASRAPLYPAVPLGLFWWSWWLASSVFGLLPPGWA